MKTELDTLREQVRATAALYEILRKQKDNLLAENSLLIDERNVLERKIDLLKHKLAEAEEQLETYAEYFKEIRRAKPWPRQCACGCGRPINFKESDAGRRQIYFEDACKYRAYRFRKKLSARKDGKLNATPGRSRRKTRKKKTPTRKTTLQTD
jgi:hypothetical protein